MTKNTKIFQAVAARRISPDRGAELLFIEDEVSTFWSFLCTFFGHKKAIEMLPDEETNQATWMCPRCGTYHSVIGGMYPPHWKYHRE